MYFMILIIIGCKYNWDCFNAVFNANYMKGGYIIKNLLNIIILGLLVLSLNGCSHTKTSEEEMKKEAWNEAKQYIIYVFQETDLFLHTYNYSEDMVV